MKRLIPQENNTHNTASEYDLIFAERRKKGVDWADMRRWKTLLKYYKGGELIDLGCLDSRIIERFEDRGEYTGIDTAKNAIGAMTFLYPGAMFLVRDLYDTKFSDDQFDYAVLGEVLEHLERPQDAIEEAFRILRPGGILAISVPLDEYKEPGAVDGHRHIWSFDKNDIVSLVEPYAKDIIIKVLRSKWVPYKYCWPQLLVYAWKK